MKNLTIDAVSATLQITRREQGSHGLAIERSSSFKRSALSPNPSTLLSMVLVLFFLLDIIAFVSIGKLLLDAKQSTEGVENMEFRNPYIGLDELYGSQRFNASHYANLVNEPRLAVQISPAHPDKVFPFDAHRWLSDFGLLSPPDRHFQVSSKSKVCTTQFNPDLYLNGVQLF